MEAEAALFLDTSGVASFLIASEPRHVEARRLAAAAALRGRRSLHLSSLVLQETATLLKARRKPNLVPRLFALVEHSKAFAFHFVDAETYYEARDFMLLHEDKEWSFVDCSSFVLMRRLKLTDALTTDHHFSQAGFRPLLV